MFSTYELLEFFCRSPGGISLTSSDRNTIKVAADL